MQIPAFKILTRTARKFQPYASRAQPHDRRQGSKTGLRPLLWASAELQQPDTCYLKRCNQRPGTDTWRLGNARCAPQHATYFQAFSKTVNNDPGKVGPPNCTTENQPRHNQKNLLQLDDSRSGPARDVHLLRRLTRSKSCYRFLRNVTVMYADTVVLLLRECYDSRAPDQQLTSRKRGNSPPL